jgi:hypothetical protein
MRVSITYGVAMSYTALVSVISRLGAMRRRLNACNRRAADIFDELGDHEKAVELRTEDHEAS